MSDSSGRLWAVIVIWVLFASSLSIVCSAVDSRAEASRGPGDYTLPGKVVFYEGSGQVWSITDTGFRGYSEVANALEEEGFAVSASCLSISETVGGMDEDDMLIFSPGLWRTYDPSELDSIKSFANNGGSVIFIGEHDNVARMNDPLNHVGEEFGLEFENNMVTDTETNFDTSEWGLGDTWVIASTGKDLPQMGNIVWPAGSSVSVPPGGHVFLRSSSGSSPPNTILAGGVRTPGGGCLIAVGDSEFMINGADGIFLGYGNNRPFVLELVKWAMGGPPEQRFRPEFGLVTGTDVSMSIRLEEDMTLYLEGHGCDVADQVSGPEGNVTVELTITGDGWLDIYDDSGAGRRVWLLYSESPGKSVIIEESWNSRKADESTWGLLDTAKGLRASGFGVFAGEREGAWEDFDCVLTVNPRDDVQSNTSHDKLLVADSYHGSYLTSGGIWEDFLNSGHAYKYPSSRHLLQSRGFFWSDLLFYSSENSIQDPFATATEHEFGFGMNINRGVGLEDYPDDAFVLIQGGESTWGEAYDPFMQHAQNKSLTMNKIVERAMPVICAANLNCMALGAAEILGNQYSDTENWDVLIETLSDWLGLSVRIDETGLLDTQNRVTVEGSHNIVYSEIEHDGAIELREKNGVWTAAFPSHEGQGEITLRIECEYAGGISGTYEFVLEVPPGGPNYLPVMAVVAAAVVLMSAYILRRNRQGKSVEEDEGS